MHGEYKGCVFNGPLLRLSVGHNKWFDSANYIHGMEFMRLLLLIDLDSSQLCHYNGSSADVTLYSGGFGLLAFRVWILGDQILLSWTQMNIKLRVCVG